MSIDTKELNITIECGADFLMTFVVRDSADALVDLTGAEVTAQIREYAEAVDYYQMTAVHNGAGGKVTLGIAYEDTERISFSRGVYDVFIDFPNDTREKYLQGSVTVIPSVTKPIDGQIMYLLSFSSEGSFPVMGLVNRVYFSHASGKMYRWNGTGYVGIVRDGDAATVEVGTVETLPAGSDATVENVGSLTNAVFNFGIPKGDKGDPGVTEWDDIQNKPETFPPEDHDHDDRYYTEEEVDTMLGMKADAADLGDLAEKDMADWDTDIDNIPEAFPPETHDHDDRYYTELETDALLADKVDDDDLGSMAYEDDAPSDGKQYARKDGDWAEVTGGGGGGDVISRTASGTVVTIEDAAAAPVLGLTVGIEPVQDLHGQPSPYPAGGGRNLMPYATSDEISQYPVLDGDYYYYTLTGLDTTSNYAISLYRATVSSASSTVSRVQAIGDTSNNPIVFNPTSAIGKVTITKKPAADGTLQIKIHKDFAYLGASFHSFQIEKGSSTDYAPYANICPISGHTEVNVCRETSYDADADPVLTINLGDTVYGGTLDATAGTLTMTDANIASYAGETLPGVWISDRDAYAVGTTPTTGAQVVYKLEDPQIVHLTPNQMQTLLGTNVIWTDTGDVELAYRADTQRYIEARLKDIKLILTPNVETEMTASKNYTSGDIVIVGDTFLKITANITAGSALTIGSNCVVTTMADWITSLL